MGIPVKYTGPTLDATGYGAANRAFIAALHMSGCDVVTEPIAQTKDRTSFGWEGELAHQLSDRRIDYKIKILHLTPDFAMNYFEKGKYNIAHLFWETDRLPTEWIEPLNKMGEVWTSSAHMAKLFKENGVNVPIYWFPQPIDITAADKNYQKYAVAHHSGFLFYAIFQWIERKNPKALIKAYWSAFTGRTDVSLLIKTWRLSYDETEFEKIRDDIYAYRKELPLAHYPRILLVKKIMDQQEMMRLHMTGDCFVQADRGEGWSRVVQESLLLGKPVIATSRGGIHEYLKDEHYFKVPSTYVPVTEIPWVKFYTKDQNWADIDQEKLKHAMQYVYNNQVLSGAKGTLGKIFVKNNFNYQAVGNAMRERLEKIHHSL